MITTDDRQRLGCGMAAGVLLILGGIVAGFGVFVMMAAGCGYVGSCKISTLEEMIPLIVGAVPVAAGVTLVVLSVHRKARDEVDTNGPTSSGEPQERS
jgi:hypothetical protein